MTLAYMPSPPEGVWYLGPVPIRAYALCIIAGIVVAIWLTQRRWEVRGGRRDDIVDVAVWAVPFGIVGGRLYHVVTDPSSNSPPGSSPSAPSTFGTAAWASGARSPSAPSVHGSAAAAAASPSPTSPTPWRPASSSPRPSDAGATG